MPNTQNYPWSTQFIYDGRPTVIYDMDGVLWPLDWRTAERLKVDRSLFTTYFFHENVTLPPERRNEAYSLFADPQFFEDINFYEGVAGILRPEELGVRVVVVSNSLNAEVAAKKYPQLLAAVPGLRSENVVFNILNAPHDAQKVIDEHTLILVEDSPHNVAGSPAKLNVMIRIPWNCSPSATTMLAGREVVWCDTLSEANDLVYDAVRHFLGR